MENCLPIKNAINSVCDPGAQFRRRLETNVEGESMLLIGLLATVGKANSKVLASVMLSSKPQVARTEDLRFRSLNTRTNSESV